MDQRVIRLFPAHASGLNGPRPKLPRLRRGTARAPASSQKHYADDRCSPIRSPSRAASLDDRVEARRRWGSRRRPSGLRSAAACARRSALRAGRGRSASPPPIGRRGGFQSAIARRFVRLVRRAAGGRPRIRCRRGRRAPAAMRPSSASAAQASRLRALFDSLSRAAIVSATSRLARQQGGQPAQRSGAIAGVALGGDQRFEVAQRVRARSRAAPASGCRARASCRPSAPGRAGRAASAARRRCARATGPSGRWRARCRRRARRRRARPRRSGRGSGRSAGSADGPRRCAASGSPMKRTRRCFEVVEPAEIVEDLAGHRDRRRAR